MRIMPAVRAAHADSRLPLLLDESARLFRERGYEGTTVRDIARAAGILPGSIYAHFATKDELLRAVYVRGVEQVTHSVEQAISAHQEPWARLEAACVAHLEAILRDDDYAQVVVRVRPSDAPGVQADLVVLRNSYEALFSGLIKALPLARGVDRPALRLMLMGALNWSQTWYREGGRFHPRVIARKFVSLLRQGLETSP